MDRGTCSNCARGFNWRRCCHWYGCSGNSNLTEIKYGKAEEINIMNKPKVSIIIPVYNGEKYLRETIESCVKQNYDNLEIIIIDDCSKDNSKNIALSFKNSNISYSQNINNLGINTTINNGIKSSKGDYVLGLGQDDILPHNHSYGFSLKQKANVLVYSKYQLFKSLLKS